MKHGYGSYVYYYVMIVACIIMSCDVEICIMIVLRMCSVQMYEKSMRFG